MNKQVKTYSFNLVFGMSILLGLVVTVAIKLYLDTPKTLEPKFKAGDCVVGKSKKGEFLELSDQSNCRLILQVGKEAYLYRVVSDCNQNEGMKFFGSPSERPIVYVDESEELTSAERCQQIPPKFKVGNCVAKNDDEYSCFLIKEIKDEEYIVIRDSFCKTKHSKKQEDSISRTYLEQDSAVVDSSRCQ